MSTKAALVSSDSAVSWLTDCAPVDVPTVGASLIAVTLKVSVEAAALRSRPSDTLKVKVAWPAPEALAVGVKVSLPCATRSSETVSPACTAKLSSNSVPFVGKVVICTRGENARVDKSLAVLDAGGVGMVLVCAPAHEASLLAALAASGEAAWRLGEVV